MSTTQTTAGSQRRYPRTCAHCGAPFVAARSHARWCSNKCRLRAWRDRRRPNDGPESKQDVAQFSTRLHELEAAPEVGPSVDVCAQRGCRILAYFHKANVVSKDEQRAEIAPWRSTAWNDPAVRQVRARLSEQADELDGLREENALLRRWVSERLDVNGVHGRGG